MIYDKQFLTAPHWQRIGVRHHHGICLPLSAIYTEHSCGVGEFLDLIPLLEWLRTTGFDLIQLLPITDSGDDPSPYMGISAHALHPIYLSLKVLPGIFSIPGMPEKLNALSQSTSAPRLLYHQVLQQKHDVLALYLDHFLPDIEATPEYQQFIHENRSWLTPYSIFKTLKRTHHGKAWWDWEHQPSSSSICHTDTLLANEVMRWRAIQYLCFQQMRAVKSAADRYGMVILGDVPILINKDSADVWWHPDLFCTRSSVGAPPDMYNKEGQFWGFPRYNWSHHRKTHFSWWKERLHLQEAFFHMFRIDHLVGFYRLWTIPSDKKASHGHFIPKTPQEWLHLGEEVLSTLISSTTMLPLGEDLGDVPDLVRESMRTMGIPGLKVLRWERKWKTDRSFINPKGFSPESLSTLSTHDSSTVAGWWEEAPEETKQLAHDYNTDWSPKCTPSMAYDLLKVCHSSGSLFHVNLFSEYLSLFHELSWNDPGQERINVPGIISPNNWTYRFRRSLETIISHKKLAKTMSALI